MSFSKFFLVVIAVLPAFAIAQQPADAERETRVAWLKEHAVALRSIDPADEDFSDLEPLRKVIGDSRIVQLGEQSHGDGTTFHAEARLIKFLHQKMGFDVLAMESGLYDCRKAWELLREGKEPYEAATHGIFGIWNSSEQFQPVIDYLGKSVKSDRPLELCGFDCQFTGKAIPTHLTADVTKILDQLGEQSISAESRGSFLDALAAMIKRQSTPPTALQRAAAKKAAPPDKSAQEQQQKGLAAFSEALARAKPSEALPAHELAFWRQYAASLVAEAEKQGTFPSDPRQGNRLRDIQMAKNLVWLAREAYPQRKIIVWAASYHLMRNPSAVQPLGGRLGTDFYRDAQTMGDGVWKELGRATYTLGFITAEGEAGLPITPSFKLDPPERGSIEDLLVIAGATNAIVDFRQLDPSGAWLRERLAARPVGYGYMTADWTNVFDGLVFTKTMFPSTLAERARPRTVPPQLLAVGWFGPRKGAGDFESGIDADIKHGGNASAYIRSVGDTPKGFGTLTQVIAADQYRGKRLRMTAFVKSENVAGAAGLWMRVDGKELTSLAFDNMLTRPIQGTGDWQSHAVVLDLPEESTDITFGILLRGQGQIWIDDLQFDVVGPDVVTTAMNAPKTKRQGKGATNLPKEPQNLNFER